MPLIYSSLDLVVWQISDSIILKIYDACTAFNSTWAILSCTAIEQFVGAIMFSLQKRPLFGLLEIRKWMKAGQDASWFAEPTTSDRWPYGFFQLSKLGAGFAAILKQGAAIIILSVCCCCPCTWRLVALRQWLILPWPSNYTSPLLLLPTPVGMERAGHNYITRPRRAKEPRTQPLPCVAPPGQHLVTWPQQSANKVVRHNVLIGDPSDIVMRHAAVVLCQESRARAT